MAIDLRPGGEGFFDVLDHLGHDIEVATYGHDPATGEERNVGIECVTCHTVLVDFDVPETKQRPEDHANCEWVMYKTDVLGYAAEKHDGKRWAIFDTEEQVGGGWDEVRCRTHDVPLDVNPTDIDWG